MNVRLISGKFGGRRIITPSSDKTHPMSGRVRSALFNILGDSVKDARVLDAFAGSGSLGLEAISRGAKSVTFIERDGRAIKALTDNIAGLRVNKETAVIKTSIDNWLRTSSNIEFDLIFADPPYYDPQFSTVQKLFSVLHIGALMVLSHPGRGEPPISTNEVVVVDNRSYAGANLTFYRRIK